METVAIRLRSPGRDAHQLGCVHQTVTEKDVSPALRAAGDEVARPALQRDIATVGRNRDAKLTRGAIPLHSVQANALPLHPSRHPVPNPPCPASPPVPP